MERINFEEWTERLKVQDQPREHKAFRCPVCGTIQSMASLRRAGVPEDRIETQIGFSCEGRWTNAGPWGGSKTTPERAAIRGCDWTLGGLFTIHELEVEDPEGKVHPMFQIASAEQAADLRASMETEQMP